jgi:hypothetical protein
MQMTVQTLIDELTKISDKQAKVQIKTACSLVGVASVTSYISDFDEGLTLLFLNPNEHVYTNTEFDMVGDED